MGSVVVLDASFVKVGSNVDEVVVTVISLVGSNVGKIVVVTVISLDASFVKVGSNDGGIVETVDKSGSSVWTVDVVSGG